MVTRIRRSVRCWPAPARRPIILTHRDGCSWRRKRQTQLRQDATREVRTVGDQAIDPPTEQPVHVPWMVDRPRYHTQAKRMGFGDDRFAEIEILRTPGGSALGGHRTWH